MAIEISNAGGTMTQQLQAAIEAALPGARAEAGATSPGHFQLRVVWQGFAGRSRLQQQQAVYQSIAHLMRGDAAPVHAIDRLETYERD